MQWPAEAHATWVTALAALQLEMLKQAAEDVV